MNQGNVFALRRIEQKNGQSPRTRLASGHDEDLQARLGPAEQDVLDHVTVRLIRPEERAAFDELLIKEHYLHNAELVGEQLRYVADTPGNGGPCSRGMPPPLTCDCGKLGLGGPPAEEAPTHLGGEQ